MSPLVEEKIFGAGNQGNANFYTVARGDWRWAGLIIAVPLEHGSITNQSADLKEKLTDLRMLSERMLFAITYGVPSRKCNK